MPTLILEVADSERGLQREFSFSRSPVRVGRSALNDLPLERSFVSSCHGVFQFDDRRCEFVDLGSTNGTTVHGQRIAPNQPITLASDSIVCIGQLSLRARRAHTPRSASHSSYALRHDLLASSSDDTPLPSAPPARPGAPAEENGELLRFFARAFLELRRGQRQMVRELGLVAAEQSALSAIDDEQALVGYLASAQPGRLDELSRAHAELMLHQVALLNGIVAGGRELLEQVSPSQLALRHTGIVASIKRLFGRDTRWHALQEGFRNLEEDSELSRVLLGRAFARAYATCMGRTAHSGSSPTRESERP